MANARRPGVRKLFNATAREDEDFAAFQRQYDDLPEADRRAMLEDLKYS